MIDLIPSPILLPSKLYLVVGQNALARALGEDMEPRGSYLADVIISESRLQHTRTQIAIYVNLCALTAATWDWILSLADEYRVAKRCGLSAAVLAYALARMSALTLCILILVFYTGVSDDDSCYAMMQGLGALVMMGNAAKSYLFLLRVRAVYVNSKFATVCVVAGVSVLVGMRTVGTLLVHTSHPLGSAGPCDITGVGPLSAISAWFNVGYDTCIFIAISARLTSHTTSKTNTFIPFIRGHGLPRTMRHLLQDGQIYYFTTLIFMLFSAVSNTSPKINPTFQVVATIPAAVMESNMACKIFRAMILRAPDVQFLDSASDSSPARGFELDTSLELQRRMTDVEPEQI